MKQGFRMLVKPGTFMNQLQWSSRHWLILGSFFGMATLETLLGSQTAFYQSYAAMVEGQMGFSPDFAMAFVIAVKLVLMFGGSVLLSSAIWFMGNLLGRKTSKRVLFRRLSIVFTVLLGGYLCAHLSVESAAFAWMSYVAYVWAGVLAYYSLKEQFELNMLEAALVGAVGLLLVSSTWHYSNHIFEGVMGPQTQMAKKVKNAAPKPVY